MSLKYETELKKKNKRSIEIDHYRLITGQHF